MELGLAYYVIDGMSESLFEGLCRRACRLV